MLMRAPKYGHQLAELVCGLGASVLPRQGAERAAPTSDEVTQVRQGDRQLDCQGNTDTTPVSRPANFHLHT